MAYDNTGDHSSSGNDYDDRTDTTATAAAAHDDDDEHALSHTRVILIVHDVVIVARSVDDARRPFEFALHRLPVRTFETEHAAAVIHVVVEVPRTTEPYILTHLLPDVFLNPPIASPVDVVLVAWPWVYSSSMGKIRTEFRKWLSMLFVRTNVLTVGVGVV